MKNPLYLLLIITALFIGLTVVSWIVLQSIDQKNLKDLQNNKLEEDLNIDPNKKLLDKDSTSENEMQKDIENNNSNSELSAMIITSSVFEQNSSIPKIYTCDGENINPPLSISNIPENTKSLALIIEDPDAPSKVWTHWLVWNIDPKTTEITEDSIPSGAIEGTNDFGDIGYGGPCPPSGTHRYTFKLYALDFVSDLASGSDIASLLQEMDGHILQSAELTGIYSR